jgi:hypothetical protein
MTARTAFRTAFGEFARLSSSPEAEIHQRAIPLKPLVTT